MEKLHLLVVREYAFWLLFASKMNTDICFNVASETDFAHDVS